MYFFRHKGVGREKKLKLYPEIEYSSITQMCESPKKNILYNYFLKYFYNKIIYLKSLTMF